MTRLTGVLLVCVGLALGAVPAVAGDGVPLPMPARGTGDQCVEPTETMRRNHMEYLLHQRDDTVHGGIRGTKYALKDCVECHATPDPRPEVTAHTLYGFCRECHDYAAVSIDCFGCHTPESTASEGGAE